MKLDKQYHGGHQPVNIDDSIEHKTNSGAGIVCVVVLRKDGGLDVYSVPNNELKEGSNTGPRSTEAPGPPLKSKNPGPPPGKMVNISSFLSMTASPGCVCFNGTEYYW